jgi:hypothetical protein
MHRGSPRISEDDLDGAHAANQLRDAWVEQRRSYGARRLTAEIRAPAATTGTARRSPV